MNKKIKILHLEDSLLDSELIQKLLESGGIEFDYFLVENEKDFLHVLATEKIDIVLSDYRLPDFSGNEALQIVNEKYADIPFIFVSGTIGENAAISSMVNGAIDYVLKGKIDRLVPAIKRALREFEVENERKKTVIELSKSENKFRSYIENMPVGIIVLNENGKYLEVNKATSQITGYTEDELLKMTNTDMLPALSLEHEKNLFSNVINTGNASGEYLYKHKNGTSRMWSVEAVKLPDEKILKFVKDITDRKHALYARSLIEASRDPLITISVEGKITDMNEAMANITGVNRAALTGSDFFDYFTEPQKAREVYQEVFAKGFVADYPLTIKDHKLTDVLFNGSVYKDEKGNVVGAVVVARDIAAQKWAQELSIANKELVYQNEEKEKRAVELIIANKELIFQNAEKERRAAELIIANKELFYQNEEKKKRAEELVVADKELLFQIKEKEKQGIANLELEAITNSLKLASQYSRSLIEASLDPLVTISINGKIMDLNKATSEITGIVREKLIGTDFKNYFTDSIKARKVYQEVFAKGFVADYPLTIKDHKLTDVLFNGSVYKDEKGTVVGAVVVARDITEQKRIEKEMMEAKVFAELATEIAEVAKIKAEDATRIAEDAVKAKQQFLSNMSHEIRTPMNAIIGFTKVVLKTDLTAKQREYLSAIKLSGDALIVLINDILDLAKVDAGKMTFEQTPFKMAYSISAMIHLFETKIQEKNLVLVKEYDNNIPEVLVGDPVRLHQIILNLVSNAVKFTAKGKITVSVKLESEDAEKATIKFAVTDTGIGIAEEKMAYIFENFQQASSNTSRVYGGTGLGLAIVKQLVEPQGGTISVKSKVDEGSTFSFILSFMKTNSDAELETALVELDSDMKNLKVLVVEDMALNQLLMKTLLDDFGFERDIASNGKIAIEKLQTQSYDIILMDLQMPEMNGFEATEYIRNTMKLTIPIIALTADVTTVDLAKCKAVGMNDYIAKPVDERILYSKIISLVKKPVQKVQVENTEIKKQRCIDLAYLVHRTKSNPGLMMEMISLYLEQTPPLVYAMKQSLQDKDWPSLQTAVHKMIPSFSIMGISKDFENMAKQVQEYALTQLQTDGIPELILQLESICAQACLELEEEFNAIKNTKV